MSDFNYSLGFDIPSENTVNPTYKYKGGFPAGYQLPAPHFNWIIDKTSRAIAELQDKKFDRGGTYLGDMNDLVLPGQYRVQQNANLPSSEAYYGQVFVGRGTVNGGNNDTVCQLVLSYLHRRMYHRGGQLKNGVWTWEEWSTVYTSSYAPKLNKVAWLGKNPITKTTDDTTEKWIALGSGFAQYNALDQLVDQPSRYGFLVNYTYGSDIAQFWFSLPSGAMYHRAGNSSGWGQSWAKMYDTLNKPTPAEIGAAEAVKHKLITYSSLTDLGLTSGSETIVDIVTKMVDNSMLVYQTDSSNANIYPHSSLVVTVKRVNANRVEFLATRVNGSQIWFGNYHKDSGWTGWKQIYHESALPTPAQIGAVATETILDATADLNNIVTSGMYRIGKTPANAPANSDYGQLLVIHGGQDTIAQLLFPYRSTAMYVRTGFPTNIGGNGQWGEWVKMSDANHSHTPAEIGALPDAVVPIPKGGTGASDVPNARKNLNFISGTYYGTGNSGGGNMYNFDTGARGSNVIMIHGINARGFLCPWGGFMVYDNGSGVLSPTEIQAFGQNSGEYASYSDGYISLKTTHDYINVQGGVFQYWCL